MEHADDFPFAAVAVADVADMCLGHNPLRRVQKIYNQHEFQKERRILLTAWANFLTGEAVAEAEVEVEAPALSAPPEQRALPPPKPTTESEAPALWTPPDIHGLPPPKVTGSESIERVNKRVMDFLHDAYFGLLFVATHPEVPSAIQSMLGRRKSSYYKKEFLEKGPPMAEIPRFVAQYALEQAVMVAYRVFADPTLSKVERAEVVQKDVRENLLQIYNKNPDTIATALANGAIDAALTRWPVRNRKKAGSALEPIVGSDATMETAP
jgi:hypothetical protein